MNSFMLLLGFFLVVDLAVGLSPTFVSECRDPVTTVYILSESTDPVVFAIKHGIKYIGRVGKLRNTYEFQIACADNHPGGHNALANAIMTSISAGRPRRKDHQEINADIVQEIGIQKKRLMFPRTQWHLTEVGSPSYAHVPDVWRAGHTGNGSVLSVVDDGIAYNNVDLKTHFSQEFSTNYNGGGRQDPYPASRSQAHGTAAAGVAAATGANGQQNAPGCASGVAPNATLAGVRLIAEPVSDSTEADGLTYASDNVDVYSCSWGPSDDGTHLEGPGPLTIMAMNEAARDGRHGKGSIYVWAAGNGALRGDYCAYDGYVSFPVVISVAAVARDGKVADYSEECPSVFISAPSSGRGSSITTTDIPMPGMISSPSCRSDFGGTSAAAPFVAGVIALVLEVRPNLSFYDVESILTLSTTMIDATDSRWTRNAAGYYRHPKYGFGLINAQKAADLAETWEMSSLRRDVVRHYTTECDCNIPDLSYVESRIEVQDKMVVKRVWTTVDVSHHRRGHLSFTLTSPSGTSDTVKHRPADTDADFVEWNFSFLTMWGENATGTWTLKVRDNIQTVSGILYSWTLNLRGTPKQ